MSDAIVYVGTYTRPEHFVHGKGEGIYVFRLDSKRGVLHHLSTTTGLVNPAFLTIDSQRRYLYSVQEVDVFDGQPSGAVSSFRIDHETHALELINHQPTHGAHPAYISIDHTGKWLLVANYSGGNVTVLPIAHDGSLGPATAVVQHRKTPTHHDGPHPHSIMEAPGDGNHVLVADCGLDRIYVYRFDPTTGTLMPNDPPWVMLEAGAGPRHLAFEAGGRHVYCINERDSSASVLSYDPMRGVLEEIQTLSTLPDDFKGTNMCADIHLDPTGRYLYGSNRGHDSIAIFALDAASKWLHPLGHVATGGRTPRNFAIAQNAGLLLAANQDTDDIVPFHIDTATGALTSTEVVNAVPSPSCVCVV
ncbi:MAG: lactonase family protein [Chloroflexota bacterium]